MKPATNYHTQTDSRALLSPDTPKTFFWTEWGIKFAWQKKGGALHIEDINPEWNTKCKLSRWDCVKCAFGFIFAALSSRMRES